MKKIKVALVLLVSIYLANCSDSNSSNKHKKDVITFKELIYKFTPDENQEYTLYDWGEGSSDTGYIEWKTKGIQFVEPQQDDLPMFERKALVKLKFDTLNLWCLEETEVRCKTQMTLYGPKNGYTMMSVATDVMLETNFSVIEEYLGLAEKNDYEYRTIFIYNRVLEGEALYIVKQKGKQEILLHYEKSCGGVGCGAYFTVYFNFTEELIDELVEKFKT